MKKAFDVCCLNFQGSKGNNIVTDDGTAFNLMAMHGHDVHVICFQQNQREEVRNMGEQAGAITAESGMHNTNYVCYSMNSKQFGMTLAENQCNTLAANDFKEAQIVCYAIDHVVTTGGNCTAQGPCWYKDICPTEKASGVHAVCYEQN